jgi:hypothetical protein
MLEEVNSEIDALKEEAVQSAAEHAYVMNEQAHEAQGRVAAMREEIAREAVLRDLLCTWQTNALQRMSEEKASLAALLKGSPTLSRQIS